MTPYQKLMAIFEVLDGDLPDFDDEHTDEESIIRVCKRLVDVGFRVERFPDKCRLDLHIYRGAECSVVEVKQAHYRLHSEYDDEGVAIDGRKGVGDMVCEGAFVPLHKIKILGAATLAGFQHAVFAYEFTDSNEAYFIPYEVLLDKIQKTRHPLIKKLMLDDLESSREKLRKEGPFVMPVKYVARWHDTAPLLRHMDAINKNGYIE